MLPREAERARSFLLSFFYTIGKFSPADEVRGTLKSYDRVVATSYVPICSRLPGGRHLKTGSLAAVFAGSDLKEVAEIPVSALDMAQATEALTRLVVELEHRAAFERPVDGRVDITEEDTIRQAAEVDFAATEDPKWRGQEHLFALCFRLHEAVARALVSRHYPVEPAGARPAGARATAIAGLDNQVTGQAFNLPDGLLNDGTIKKLLTECGLVGASRAYAGLVRELAALAQLDDLSETRVVFLDSEPGCGKEYLARLHHLFSIRGHLDQFAREKLRSDQKMVCEVAAERCGMALGSEGDNLLKDLVCIDQTEKMLVGDVWSAVSKDPKSLAYSGARLFNFFMVNMATLSTLERLEREMGEAGRTEEREALREARRALG